MQSFAQASRPPSRPGGRFRHRAHFAVTRGALSRLAPSCRPESRLRSRQQRPRAIIPGRAMTPPLLLRPQGRV
ncbi:hypothetical protein NDU88_005337 [Pleurodeles waltl]|uniref:Uncharacterized protein n=1 Tax=Pleurodeles waltl TaxID=8319 RepID=A0AAV7QKN6_PLEWA|nr:hypothetical protein NDU88_005337 [Pleurodeles waltl]